MLEVKRKPASPSSSHGQSAAGTAKARIQTESVSAPKPPEDNAANPHSFAGVPHLPRAEAKDFQTRLPVITGEAHFQGAMSVNGLLSGQLGSASCLTVKQRSSSFLTSGPDLCGDISFKGMVRVNGHIAGTVYSENGTLIVDTGATVESNVDVAVVVIGGTIKGDIVARERVELGPTSKIYGNIWTRSIVIKNGAIFEGVCRMIEEAQKAS